MSRWLRHAVTEDWFYACMLHLQNKLTSNPNVDKYSWLRSSNHLQATLGYKNNFKKWPPGDHWPTNQLIGGDTISLPSLFLSTLLWIMNMLWAFVRLVTCLKYSQQFHFIENCRKRSNCGEETDLSCHLVFFKASSQNNNTKSPFNVKQIVWHNVITEQQCQISIQCQTMSSQNNNTKSPFNVI